MAIKSVVEPRHKRAHYQDRYSTVVDLRKQFADEVRVAVQRVEHAGTAQTDYDAREENAENDLLLQLYSHLQ